MITLLLLNWVYIILLMSVVWLIYLTIKNPGIIDVFWSIAITVSSLHYLFTNQLNAITSIYFFLVLLWCIRLSGHLFITRIIPNIKEKRYIELSENWKGSKKFSFLLHYQFQGILAIILATPFLWIRSLTAFSVLTALSIVFIVIGIAGETIADMQLFYFKKAKKGPVCNTGLWRYSRHPNYFFEFLIWVGFSIGAISISPFSYLSLISPALLLFLMLKVTGPITEKSSLKSKGEAFRQYQKETSYFVPLPKKNLMDEHEN